jgi:hypothetical protein
MCLGTSRHIHISQENGQSGKKTLCLFNIFLYDIMKYHHYFEDLKDELSSLLVWVFVLKSFVFSKSVM